MSLHLFHMDHFCHLQNIGNVLTWSSFWQREEKVACLDTGKVVDMVF